MQATGQFAHLHEGGAELVVGRAGQDVDAGRDVGADPYAGQGGADFMPPKATSVRTRGRVTACARCRSGRPAHSVASMTTIRESTTTRESHAPDALGIRLAAVAPVLLIIGSLLVPAELEEPVGGDRTVALRHLAVAADHRAAVRAGYLVLVIALVMLAPAVAALATLIAGRGARTTTVGAAATAIAVALGAAVNLTGLITYRAPIRP